MGFFQGLDVDLTNSRCDNLRDPSYLNLTLSIFILLGIILSYLYQHYRIIHRRTSEGISIHFILLGVTSGTSAFANILVLPVSRADVACCKAISGFECAAGLLGIIQVGAQWACFVITFILFMVFFPRDSTLPNNSGKGPETWRDAVIMTFSCGTSSEGKETWQDAIVMAIVCVLHALLVVLVSIILIFGWPHTLGSWANILGIAATLLAMVQYLPQISLTWRLRHVGSLSIPMMLIQTPGSFVWSASLAARLGPSGWSTWGVFLVTGCLQACLLVMGIYFEIQAKRSKQNTEGEGANARCIVGYIPSSRINAETDDEGGPIIEEGLNERTPLIKGSKRSSRTPPASSNGNSPGC